MVLGEEIIWKFGRRGLEREDGKVKILPRGKFIRKEKECMEQENWYILRTFNEQEKEAAELFIRAVPKSMYSLCRIPQKLRAFRTGGEFRLVKDIMFPGYLFVKTGCPEKLQKELKKSREFPQFFPFGKNAMGEDELIEVGGQDLAFLQKVCGTELQTAMGVSDVMLGEDKKIVEAHGALEHYVHQIVRQNLHRRFAVAEVPLFNRKQTVLFGIKLEQDRYFVA